MAIDDKKVTFLSSIAPVCIINILSNLDYLKCMNSFTYDSSELENFYVDICKNSTFYISGHRFLSKYDQGKVVEMLTESTSKQLQNFRGILFAVYRYAKKGNLMKRILKQ